jgi:hypothetical protein
MNSLEDIKVFNEKAAKEQAAALGKILDIRHGEVVSIVEAVPAEPQK